jgi:flagellar hook protein FlgE
MGSALWAGISGLNASSKELDVIANNLANVNTIGFKSGTTYFADVLSQSISGGSSGNMQVGRGVSVSEVQTQFSSGSFESTGNATDVAIDGDGFFMVNNAEGGTFYTRAGAFRLNSEGLLVDTEGNKVQGKAVVGGEPVGALGDINLSDVQSSPEVTTTFAIGANLDSGTATGGQYNTTQTVYDSLGAKHTLNTTFTKTAHPTTGYWAVESSLDSDAATSISANGFIFDADGICTGLYTGTSSAVTSATAVNTVSAVTEVTAGDGTATATLDHWAVANAAADTMTLRRGATAATWTITDLGAYPSATVVSADATTVNISLDGSGTIDLHLTLSGTWANADTATYTLTPGAADTSTATVTLDRPGMVYQTGSIALTKGLTSWTIADNGGYTGAIVTSSGLAGPLTISLDGTGTTDVTIALDALPAWATGDIAKFTLTHTAVPFNDITVNFSAPLEGGATIGAAGDMNWNLLGNGSLNITQYSTASVIRALTADGFASGNLKTLSIDADGRISGFFTNGQTSDLSQLMIAQFSNPWGLKKMGSNLFGETVSSGSAIQNYPGQSGLGTLTPNTLEMSNTDIATEFIKMITAQKAYQASARVVTTEDAIMQELMNLKR